MVGSAAFALGALPAYADRVGARLVGLTYFAGSIFFTSAGYLQYVQTINAPEEIGAGASRARIRLLAWQPQRIDWWATSVQTIGTLLFNVSTFNALQASFSLQQQSDSSGPRTCSDRSRS